MKASPRARGRTYHLEVSKRDHVGNLLASGSWYEAGLLHDIASRELAGRLAVDCGAHIGNHAIWMAGVCGMRVVALEPWADNRAVLVANIALNHLEDRVTVLPMAAGARAGRAKMYLPDRRNIGTARIGEEGLEEVEVIALDDIGVTDVAVLKIDVEGKELEVLEGAVGMLARSRPVVYVEATDVALVTAFMTAHGYRRFARFCRKDTFGFEPA